MTILSSVRTFLATFTLLDGQTILIDHLDSEPITYSIVPVPGQRIISTDILGNTTRIFPFLLQTNKSTADDLERLETAGFHEALMDWFDQITDDQDFTNLVLDANKTPESIAAESWGYLYEQGESDTGIYQISCVLTYRQAANN